MTYIALLRGINVGGKAKIAMSDLRQCLTEAGLKDVRTYIQSGNVVFNASLTSTELVNIIERAIMEQFGFEVPTAVFAERQWHKIIQAAPPDWGKDPNWKHNLLILLTPYNMDDVMATVGELKPDIESMVPGEGVIYQSMSRKLFGRTTTGKLASNPIYKRMTIRNYNTSVKLLSLLEPIDNA